MTAANEIQEAIQRVRLATGTNEAAQFRDVAIVLSRLDALEIGLQAVRDFIAEQPSDIFGLEYEGDPEIGCRTTSLRDFELWHIDQVLKGGLAASGRRHADRYEAQFDAMVPRQEELAIEFTNEISQARERGVSIDAIRLLEMADALYQAEMDDSRRDTYPDEDRRTALRTLDRILSGVRGLPEGRWVYRPNPEDDWGMVRNLDKDGACIGFIANARSGRYDLEDSSALATHRTDRTDPYAPVGRHIANCNPEAILEISALVRHLEAEVRRLSALDREYTQVESWILRNAPVNERNRSTNKADRLIGQLQTLKDRADGAGRRILK